MHHKQNAFLDRMKAKKTKKRKKQQKSKQIILWNFTDA